MTKIGVKLCFHAILRHICGTLRQVTKIDKNSHFFTFFGQKGRISREILTFGPDLRQIYGRLHETAHAWKLCGLRGRAHFKGGLRSKPTACMCVCYTWFSRGAFAPLCGPFVGHLALCYIVGWVILSQLPLVYTWDHLVALGVSSKRCKSRFTKMSYQIRTRFKGGLRSKPPGRCVYICVHVHMVVYSCLGGLV